MERNAKFHEAGLPHLEALLYTPVVDENARAAALRAGDVDIIDYVPFQEFARFKQGPRTMLAEGIEYGKWRSVRLNNSVAPLNDPRVRQALNWAIDRTKAAEIIVADFGGPWTEMNALPKDSWAHTSDGLTQYTKPDIEKAKQLLSAAGVANGFKMSLKIFQGSNWPVQLSQVVQADWKKIGVEVTIDSLENTVFSSDYAAGKFEMATTGGGITGSDPDYLYSQFHSSATARTDRFADPQVDQLLDAGRTTLDQAKRKQVYADVQKRISELAPWVIVFRADDREALSTRLRGFTHMPNYQMVTLRSAWLAP
jgi:peptide/nickel transport system substrate-binding protein